MQYCGAAPIAKMMPYSESRTLALRQRSLSATANSTSPWRTPARYPPTKWMGSRSPLARRYSANHMWLDVDEDGLCHAGIDAFLSRALGPRRTRQLRLADAASTAPPPSSRSTAMDHDVVFPNPFLLTNCNLYLRTDPSRLTSDPYTGGWLFEGVPTPETTEQPAPGRRRAPLDGAGTAPHQRVPAATRTTPMARSRPMAGLSPTVSPATSIATRCWPCSMNFSRLCEPDSKERDKS